MREIRDSYTSSEQSCRCDSYHSGAGSQLKNTEAAVLVGVDKGGEIRGGRVTSTAAVEEGDEGGGGGPELEGEAL